MKKLLLTGGAGFIGHHTVEHFLKNTDYGIVIIDNLNYSGNLNYLADIGVLRLQNYRDRVRIVYHDLRAPISDLTLHLIGDIDYVIHMAAESHVDNSILNPEPFVMSNIVGTMNVLDMCKKIFPQKIIYVSTDEVYGPSINGHLHKEGEPHRPGNPYSASKAGAEDLCFAYHNTYEMPIIISNTMNNFGERQHPEKFVPKVMRSHMLRQPVTLHCKRDPVTDEIIDISSRCWLHARNHADALLFLLDKGIVGERYNVTGELLDVYEMAEHIAGFLGMLGEGEYNFVDFHSFRKGHDMHYGLDGSKMKELGWVPPLDLDTSLQNTVRWCQENKQWLGL